MIDLRLGDSLDVLRELDDESVHAVITDPPYGIGFMGKHWDGASIRERVGRRDQLGPMHWTLKGTGRTKPRSKSAFANEASAAGDYDTTDRGNRAFQAWCEQWAAECLRVLKPGGHLASFGGTRTYHRLTAGIEEAGFEVRDCLAWLFGSGFPKSRNLDGDWGGWGTALKPAFEPIVLARKPLAGTVAVNVAEYGVGALNIAGCGIPIANRDAYERNASGDRGHDGTRSIEKRGATDLRTGGGTAAASRWPANVILDEEAAALLDHGTGHLHATGNKGGTIRPGAKPTDVYLHGRGAGVMPPGYPDAGGASRFFYCAKTSRAERHAGLDGYCLWQQQQQQQQAPVFGAGVGSFEPRRNTHPTVKPIALMRWLCRLITPPGGVILDPFLGSGTTAIAAALEGFNVIGIEREPDYLQIARARIAYWTAQPLDP